MINGISKNWNWYGGIIYANCYVQTLVHRFTDVDQTKKKETYEKKRRKTKNHNNVIMY